MALKLKVKKIEDVPEAFRGEYKPEGDGFTLDLGDDLGPLLRARDHEKDQRKLAEDAAKTSREEAEVARQELADFKTKRSGKPSDLEALETSYKEKLAKAATDHKALETGYENEISGMLIDREVTAIVGDISTAPALLAPVVRGRLVVVKADGKRSVKVLGSDGKPAATTLDELKAEISGQPEYAAVIKATQASGGSANASKGNGSAGSGKTIRQAAFDAVPLHERGALIASGVKVVP